jgi:hypothetical protein
MNVGELKELLRGIPDDYDVTIVMNNSVEALWRSIDEMRTGWRGLIAGLIDPPPENYRDNRLLHTWAASARVVMWKGKNFGEFRIENGDHCPSLGGKYDQPEEEPSRIGKVDFVPSLSAGDVRPPDRPQLSSGQGIEKR